MITQIMYIAPNSVDGLLWGLKNFDGIETDLRLSKNHEIFIHHDPFLEDGRYLSDLSSAQLSELGIPKLSDFFNLPTVKDYADKGKRFLLELKPNCNGKKSVVFEIRQRFRESFDQVVETSGVNPESITIISFSEVLLDAFVDTYKCVPLLPSLNECESLKITRWRYLKLMGKFLSNRLPSYMKYAKKKGYHGVYFAREYIMGGLSRWHGSYSSKIALAKELELELGTNTGSASKDPVYPELLRVTDDTSIFPRHASEGEGKIIAHRGTGTKGVHVEKL